MSAKQTLAFMLLLAVFSRCGNNNAEKQTTTDTTKTTITEDNASTNATKAPTANIHVVITGGERAGTYDAVCNTACCSYEIAGDNIFGNQYSETGKKPTELSSVQLVVEDVTGNKTTENFLVTVSFGDMMTNEFKSYTIDTHKGRKEGSGTLDLQYANNKGMVRIKGKTKEGVGLDVTLNCSKVYTTQMLTDEIMQEN